MALPYVSYPVLRKEVKERKIYARSATKMYSCFDGIQLHRGCAGACTLPIPPQEVRDVKSVPGGSEVYLFANEGQCSRCMHSAYPALV